MARIVLLPKALDSKLHYLTAVSEETNGVLLYQRQGNLCPIDAMFITGTGNEGHVASAPERMDVVNAFLKKVPSYDFIKFHTHTEATIERFGAYYATNFSDADIAGIRDQFRDYKEFIAMLVTPRTKLLCGLDNPKLQIVDSHSGEQRGNTVDNLLVAIARNLGYEL